MFPKMCRKLPCRNIEVKTVTYVAGCGLNPPARVYDRSHRLVAEWPGSKYSLLTSPIFGPNSEVFALATDGSILRLRITLPAR